MEEQYCTPEEQTQRLEICKNCNRFWLDQEGKTYCLEISKSISFMITEKTMSCPLGKFE